MDFEPMDVDKSASSASKMDISCNDSDSDVCIFDNDNISPRTKKEVPDAEVGNDETLSTGNIFSKTSNNLTNNSEVKVKTEKPDNFHMMEPESGHSELFVSRHVLSTEDVTNVRDESIAKPVQFKPVKTYHIKKQPLQKKKTPSKIVFFVIGASVLFLSVVTYQVLNFKCAEEIDLRMVRKSFTENLFGQSAASNKIIEYLDMEDKSKIIFLYGGTGVGKTYAVSLILDKLWNSANVYHYTMPTFADTFSSELMLGLTVCKTTILVVDDLTRNDMHITAQIKNVIAKGENLGKNVTIVLVYNCDNVTENFVKKCDMSFHTELKESFRHIDAEKYFVQFQPLEQVHLIKCIERELGNRKVSRQDMNNILKNFDVSLDGCKGVYTKIKLLNVI